MGAYKNKVGEKNGSRSVEMWIGVWRIIQMNEKFHELGTGNLMESYGRGMVNDPHIPKTNRIDSVHCISIWLLKDYKSVKTKEFDTEEKY